MSGNSPLSWKLLLIQDQDFELPEHDYALVARPCQLSRAYAGAVVTAPFASQRQIAISIRAIGLPVSVSKMELRHVE